MKNNHSLSSQYLKFIALLVLLLHPISFLSIQASETSGILRAEKVNPTTVDVLFTNNQRMTIDFYGENIFRIFQDNSGGIIRDPEAKPEARILVDQPRRKVSGLALDDRDGRIILTTGKVRIEFDKQTSLMKVFNLETNVCVIEQTAPVAFSPKEVTVTLKEQPDEYFYGGELKTLLKKAYEEVFPQEILYRKKKGFAIPGNYISGGNNTVYERLLKLEWKQLCEAL